MINIFFLLTVGYFLLILFFAFGVIFIKEPQNKKIHPISIIVAVRNEEKYIYNLLEILSNQNYPKYEVIIANDRSTDKTQSILENFKKTRFPNLKIVKIDNEPENIIGKKNALNEAIKISKNEILVFTDADCLPLKNWLSEINKMYNDDVDIIAGYSPLIDRNGKLSNLIKNLERSSIFAITSGSFFWNWGITCTARNFSYRKSLFEKCQGFDSIAHIRSGDDDLLLQKMSKYSQKMKFMFSQNSIVPSFDKEDIASQISLETRRGSKWKYYTFSVKLLSLFVMTYYLSLTYILFLSISNPIYLKIFLTSFFMKAISEFILLLIFLFRIKQLRQLKYFIITELFYIPYFIFFGIKGTFGKYKWKN